MYHLEYLKLAKDDMEKIVYYISNNLQNRTAALNLANEFIKCANSILEFPYGNAEYIPVKPLKNKYRTSKVKNFIMFYTVNDEKKVIMIVRVLYQKQDTSKELN